MTFNDNSNFDSGHVRRRRPSSGGGMGGSRGGGGGGGGLGRGGAIGGGGILLVLVAFLVSQFLGVDITGMLGGASSSSSSNYADEDFACTGQEANAQIDCRIEGAAVSLEQYWTEAAPTIGIDGYVNPTVYIFEQQTNTACGTASSAIGPFYCPADQSIYVDTSFFDILVQQYGAEGGPLAEMYVVAHEWGHHIQNLGGILSSSNTRDEGPTGGAVRTELQADCLAGAWMQSAAKATDSQGNQLMQEPTRAEIQTTISAAQAIGDDHIQEQAGMDVQPESFTHGTSEQRTNWLMAGYQGGASACNTFSVPDAEL
ncbi:KPN_02809 family neutral zinc metallopeptidase [Gulosibacter molinativorax]|uniref:Neutral zinc metallopeptidase n=1 Tax=Gulosibacter molinativorax TaxID=256821 RepID=A0ABT7C7Z4_9MICO|nr:neutral zinc metallopeptidase [Gulosibacter molinativorax]MDJ1371361.1 neutral zinc metallopeptidase [Gulosibacter molinativorax]QUY62858.1 Predicted metalloprotease [Gulosibacter molinativorax]